MTRGVLVTGLLLAFQLAARAEPPDEPGAPSAGTAPEIAAPATPPPAAQAAPSVSSASRAEYDRRLVGFAKIAVIQFETSGSTVYAQQTTGQWGPPFLGRERRPLEPLAFYVAVDRPDLALAYRQRSRRKVAWMLSGAAALLGGVALGIAGAAAGAVDPFCREQDRAGVCIDADRSPSWGLFGVGAAVVAVGLAALIVGAATDRSPTTLAQSHRLAAEHNRRLRRDLGLLDLPDDDVPDAEDHPPTMEPLPPALIPALRPKPPRREPRNLPL